MEELLNGSTEANLALAVRVGVGVFATGSRALGRAGNNFGELCGCQHLTCGFGCHGGLHVHLSFSLLVLVATQYHRNLFSRLARDSIIVKLPNVQTNARISCRLGI